MLWPANWRMRQLRAVHWHRHARAALQPVGTVRARAESLTPAMLSPLAGAAAPTVGPAGILSPDRIELFGPLSSAEAQLCRIAISPERAQQNESKPTFQYATQTSQHEPKRERIRAPLCLHPHIRARGKEQGRGRFFLLMLKLLTVCGAGAVFCLDFFSFFM